MVPRSWSSSLRRRTAPAAVALALLAAAGGGVAGAGCSVGARREAARTTTTDAEPAPTSSTSTTTTAPPPPATAETFPGVDQLAADAMQLAVANGEDAPTDALVVRTTRDKYATLEGTRVVGPAPEVYVVQLAGRFRCMNCGVQGPAPEGEALRFAWDPAGQSVVALNVASQPADLSGLGTVHRLPLSPAG